LSDQVGLLRWDRLPWGSDAEASHLPILRNPAPGWPSLPRVRSLHCGARPEEHLCLPGRTSRTPQGQPLLHLLRSAGHHSRPRPARQHLPRSQQVGREARPSLRTLQLGRSPAPAVPSGHYGHAASTSSSVCSCGSGETTTRDEARMTCSLFKVTINGQSMGRWTSLSSATPDRAGSTASASSADASCSHTLGSSEPGASAPIVSGGGRSSDPLRLQICINCGRSVWQRDDLWTGKCHGCSGDCLLDGGPS
jgi:hypothetical protein